MPAPFTWDPTTAYQHTGRYVPGAVEAMFQPASAANVPDGAEFPIIIARANVDTGDWQSYAGALLLEAESTVFYGWRDISTIAPDPVLDDFITIASGEDEGVWKVRGVSRVHWGPDWALTCVKVG